MARISTYVRDTIVTKDDKVIGTDATGSITKNFNLEGIGELFGRGLIPIHTQAGYRFRGALEQGAFSGPSDGAAFSSLTSLKFSQIDQAEHNLQNFIPEYNNQRIILFQNRNKNNYGIYTVTNIEEDPANPGYFIFSLTHNSSNGVLVLDNYYSLAIYSGDLHYIHTQNIASATWTINHNLGKFGSATVVLSTGQKGYGDITYIDANNLTISFTGAETGKAYIN